MRTQILSASLLALVACGGSQKTGIGKGNTPPPPPEVGVHQDVATPGKGGAPAAPKIEVSKDAKADYKAAMDSFMTQDKVDAYCDALTTAAEPLAEKSLTAYGACLQKSTELGWFSEWSKLCERELGQIKPEQFPTASELRGDPNQVSPLITVEPPARLE